MNNDLLLENLEGSTVLVHTGNRSYQGEVIKVNGALFLVAVNFVTVYLPDGEVEKQTHTVGDELSVLFSFLSCTVEAFLAIENFLAS